MSRITADVIDVLENEKTRVEILDIDGEDATDFINSLMNKQNHIYRHQLHIVGADFNFYIEPIYSTYSIGVGTFQNIKNLFRFTHSSVIPLCFSSLYASDNADYVLTITPTSTYGILVKLYKYNNGNWTEVGTNNLTCSDFITEV